MNFQKRQPKFKFTKNYKNINFYLAFLFKFRYHLLTDFIGNLI